MIASECHPPEPPVENGDQQQQQEQQDQQPQSSSTSSGFSSMSSISFSEEKINELIHKDAQEVLESELRCAICQDIYINPMILNCSHSFCKFCLYRWLSRKTVCPECRVGVSFQAENLALRNIVNKMVLKSSPQFQTGRTTSVTQRLKDEADQDKESSISSLLKRERDERYLSGRFMRRGMRRIAYFTSIAHGMQSHPDRASMASTDNTNNNNNSSGTETETESDPWSPYGLSGSGGWGSALDVPAREDNFTFLFRNNPTSSFIRDDTDESDSDDEEEDDDVDVEQHVSSANDDSDATEDQEIEIDSSSSSDDDEVSDDTSISDEADEDDEDDNEDEVDDEDVDVEDRMDWWEGVYHPSRTDFDPSSSSSSSESSVTDHGSESISPSPFMDFMFGSDSDDSDESTEVYDSQERYRYSDDSTVQYGTDESDTDSLSRYDCIN